MNQLAEAKYLFLRAYKDEDFTKFPEHKWRVPIEFIDNRRTIFIYKDNKHIRNVDNMHNIDNMKKYEY